MMKALKAKGTPGGFALGHATGDANTWCHWLVWAFGGKMVDKNNKVVINSPETIKALEYAKELYATFIPGTLSWLDPNNNKAFLDGQISRDQQRHLDLLRGQDLEGPEDQGDGRRHQPRVLSGGAGRYWNRVPPVLQPDDLQVHQVPEGGEGVPPLHDGGGAVRRLGCRRASATSRTRSRPTRRTRSGPSTRSTRRTATRSRTCGRRATTASWATRRRARWPTSSSSTWWPKRPAARRRPKEAAERAQKRAERYYKV